MLMRKPRELISVRAPLVDGIVDVSHRLSTS